MSISDEQLAQIDENFRCSYSTKRPTVEALEQVLLCPFQVLDHGMLRVIDYMGDDGAVVQAARVSYGHGTKRVSEDANLIRYLMRHYHSTPFELCEIKLHLRMPIFVARQWIRHRTASVNEYSARYSVLSKEFYIPDRANLSAQSSTNKQGRGSALSAEEADQVLSLLREDASRNYDHYIEMLNEDGRDPGRLGLSRELARMNLTLNTYTELYWKIDAHNLMNFLRLRADSHAQYEIRVYAEVLIAILATWMPLTHAAFLDYRMNAFSLSGPMVAVVKRLIAGERVDVVNSGLSRREWSELTAALDFSTKSHEGMPHG